MKPLRLLDLFSGVGGLSLGLEQSGAFETVAFCEIDPFCRRVLAQHWPSVPRYEDVRTLNAPALSRDGIAVDAICGGFPCQDISLAGKGGGLDGERSGLWFEYARLIRELRPRFVIVENVAALLGRGMGVVLGHLAECGYDAVWRRIAAADVGAPHLRQRIWIVAYARGQQHQGFGDALWRAISEELSRASADADGVPALQSVGLAECGFPSEPSGHGREGALADAAVEPERESPDEIHGIPDGRGARAEFGRGGKRVADPCVEGLPLPERIDLCGARRRGEGRAVAEPGRRPSEPRLGRVADGISNRLDAHPGWLIEPDGLPRVKRGVRDRVGRLSALGNAVVPQIPAILGRAISSALEAVERPSIELLEAAE